MDFERPTHMYMGAPRNGVVVIPKQGTVFEALYPMQWGAPPAAELWLSHDFVYSVYIRTD